MARKKLSAQGRVVAAGVSVAVAGALAGFMAAGDHTADATQPATSIDQAHSSSSRSATPVPDDHGGFSSDSGQLQPQPQTRTGGS
jgi:hypothetical protein